MSIIINFLSGVAKVLRYWQVIVLMVIAQLFAGWLLASPLSLSMHNSWDHSLINGAVAQNQVLTSTVVDELLIKNSDQMESIYKLPMMLVGGGGYLLFSIFLLAGAMPLYSGLDLKFNWDRFWSDAARYFRPFVGLAAIAFILFFGADYLANGVKNVVASSTAGSNDEASLFVSNVILVDGLRYFLFALIMLVFQYAKIVSAAEQLRNIIYLIRRSFSFVIKHFFKVILLFSVICLVDMGISALDMAVWQYMIADMGIGVQWFWLIFSTFLFGVIKFTYLAAQMVNFLDIKRRVSESRGIKGSGISGPSGYSSGY